MLICYLNEIKIITGYLCYFRNISQDKWDKSKWNKTWKSENEKVSGRSEIEM